MVAANGDPSDRPNGADGCEGGMRDDYALLWAYFIEPIGVFHLFLEMVVESDACVLILDEIGQKKRL